MPKPRIPTWALAWLTGLALISVLFLANKSAVDRLMDTVGLTRILYPGAGSLASSVIRLDTPISEPAKIALEPIPAQQSLPPLDQTPADPSITASETSPSSTSPAPSTVATPTTPSTTPSQTGEPLFFLKMGPDGRLEPTSFVRELVAGTTPLTAALRGLLMGPTIFEKSAGAISLIPQGTQLLSARVQDGTAFLSFSEEFAHNTLGLEGLAGQLKQIVWTATQFESVQRVQFLINGQYRDSLAMDGLSIAAPLDRSSFR